MHTDNQSPKQPESNKKEEEEKNGRTMPLIYSQTMKQKEAPPN
jgi:hypothetical protein